MKNNSLVFRLGSILLCCFVFVSCTQLNTSESSQGYLLTVVVDKQDTEQGLISRYGGTVLSFQPNAGFAVLKVQKLPRNKDAAIKHIEENAKLETTDARIRIDSPNLNTQGASTSTSSIGMSGWTTWGSGWSTWASGWNTWASGQILPGSPALSHSVFMNTRVPQAHTLANRFGEGVTVAVLDTGIDLGHPAFSGRLVSSSKRWNFVNHNSDVSDVAGGVGYGHGTAVAGIILQVAPKASIMPLKVLDSNGQGDLDDVIAAIDFAVRNGARVINISLGSKEPSEALTLVLNSAIANNVYVVAAAGNQALQSADYPGALTWNWYGGSLLSVGSLDANDRLSTYTNRGENVFLYVPGDNVPTIAPNNRTANATGTSFATPLVAGALALAYSEANSDAARAQIGSYLWNSLETSRIWWRNYANGQVCNTNGGWCHGQGTLDVERLLLGIEGFVPARHNSSTDFVRNGNFESPLANTWSTTGLVQLDYNSFAGNMAAVISGSGNLSQRITGLSPNTTYRVTAWTMLERLLTGSMRVAVRNYGRTEVSATSTQTNFSQLVPISFVFTTGASNTTADIVISKSNMLGLGWVDLVTLTRN